MMSFNESESQAIQSKLFNIHDEPRNKGAWWWWFWLYFFNNPENPRRPRQLMILWSTKFDPQIECNNIEMKLNHALGQKSNMKEFDGAVAAWYYDGKKMHHNYLLEQCTLHDTGTEVRSDSTPQTTFTGKPDAYSVKIGDQMTFNARLKEKNAFTMPEYHENEYFKNKYNYKILRLNKLALTGNVKGKPINGTAYFQRLFVNAPAPPWYWGIFHFDQGSILTYFNPHLGRFLAKKALKKDITFYHAGETYAFYDIHVKKVGTDHPLFYVHGQNETHKISFVVSAYAKSHWQFKKKMFNVGPKSTLTYNEYPARVERIELVNKKTGMKITEQDTGTAVGNAEHATGLLL